MKCIGHADTEIIFDLAGIIDAAFKTQAYQLDGADDLPFVL